tara:strand:- start:1491 stop:1910 length:420 start_codon:yes stop_codon:yes gene_type:complete
VSDNEALMKKFLETAQSLDRLILALIFASYAYSGLNLSVRTASASDLAMLSPDHSIATIALRALLATVTIWLFFGVRTRVMALIGLVLYVTSVALQHTASNGQMELNLWLLTVPLLSLPLILFGGGRFSLYRAGWKGIF